MLTIWKNLSKGNNCFKYSFDSNQQSRCGHFAHQFDLHALLWFMQFFFIVKRKRRIVFLLGNWQSQHTILAIAKTPISTIKQVVKRFADTGGKLHYISAAQPVQKQFNIQRWRCLFVFTIIIMNFLTLVFAFAGVLLANAASQEVHIPIVNWPLFWKQLHLQCNWFTVFNVICVA